MKLIYIERTLHLIANSGIELPMEHILRSGEQPEVKETKNGEKYLVFEIKND